MEILTHIIGTNKPLNLRLTKAAADLNLSNCTIRFKGESNNKRQIEKVFQASPDVPTFVPVNFLDIVDETKDTHVQGRFYLAFPTGEKYASIEIYIQVKK